MGVEFRNEEVGFHKMDDVDFSDSDLVYHVKDALTSVSMGDTNKYNQLVALMHHRSSLAPDGIALLVTSLKALSGAVTYIKNDLHGSLLDSISSMSLWNSRPDVMDALLELIVSLATSSGDFKSATWYCKKGPSSIRVHSALEDIADLVPLTPKRSSSIVVGGIPPYMNRSLLEKVFSIYVENMSRLEGGAFGEVVRSTVLPGMMEIGPNEIRQDDLAREIFTMELEDVEEATDDELKDCIFHSKVIQSYFAQVSTELSQKSLEVNLYAERLDSLMVLTFEHLEMCEVSGRLTEVFEILLESFKNTILPAPKPKFCQVCLLSVVNEFLQQAKAARLFTTSAKFDFDNYLESELSIAFGGKERLDIFFPFDPYLLKKSERFIRPNFVYWSMVRPTYDD